MTLLLREPRPSQLWLAAPQPWSTSLMMMVGCFYNSHKITFIALVATVPDIQAPDVKVSESDGIAVICIKLGNEIENTFTIQYITSVVSASGNFYNFSFFKDTAYLPFFLSLIRTAHPLCSYTFSISPLPAENEDFISNTDSLVISPGETESCVEIIITDDKSPESSETFSIDFTFDLPPDTTPIPPISSMVTIVDNDVCELYFNTDRYHSIWCTNYTPFFLSLSSDWF